MDAVRLIDIGAVPPLRSQTLYHAVAYQLSNEDPDTIIVVWPNAPYVSIGLFQDLEKEVDVPYCVAEGLQIVRREVGGGAVYLDANQIFVQWVFRRTRLPRSLARQFELYVEPLVNTYRDLGIDAYFRPSNDIHVEGRKIGGTGAALIGQATVVVGSFLLDFDRSTMAKVLRVSSEKMRDKVASGLHHYMTTMADLLPALPSRREIVDRYVLRCEETLGRPLTLGAFTRSEVEEAQALDGRFLTEDWLRQKGASFRRSVKIHEDVNVSEAQYKAPGGLIRATACVRDSIIDDIELSGDFSIHPPDALSLIEHALRGCPLVAADLMAAVVDVYAEQSVESPGLTAEDVVTAVLRLDKS